MRMERTVGALMFCRTDRPFQQLVPPPRKTDLQCTTSPWSRLHWWRCNNHLNALIQHPTCIWQAVSPARWDSFHASFCCSRQSVRGDHSVSLSELLGGLESSPVASHPLRCPGSRALGHLNQWVMSRFDASSFQTMTPTHSLVVQLLVGSHRLVGQLDVGLAQYTRTLKRVFNHEFLHWRLWV